MRQTHDGFFRVCLFKWICGSRPIRSSAFFTISSRKLFLTVPQDTTLQSAGWPATFLRGPRSTGPNATPARGTRAPPTTEAQGNLIGTPALASPCKRGEARVSPQALSGELAHVERPPTRSLSRQAGAEHRGARYMRYPCTAAGRDRATPRKFPPCYDETSNVPAAARQNLEMDGK